MDEPQQQGGRQTRTGALLGGGLAAASQVQPHGHALHGVHLQVERAIGMGRRPKQLWSVLRQAASPFSSSSPSATHSSTHRRLLHLLQRQVRVRQVRQVQEVGAGRLGDGGVAQVVVSLPRRRPRVLRLAVVERR